MTFSYNLTEKGVNDLTNILNHYWPEIVFTIIICVFLVVYWFKKSKREGG